MAEFGLTDQGFVLKRLDDIISEARQDAAEIFQDLVGPDDIVDTSDSSTIGRFINLFSVSDSELWEVAQLISSAFDPNSATGIALDNLVQYGGIQRQPPTFSTSTALFEGDNGTVVSLDSVVGSNVHPYSFRVSSPVALTPSAASGIGVIISTVLNSTVYAITYSTSSGTSTNTISYTSDSSATDSEILSGLQSVITSAHPLLESVIEDGFLKISTVDIFQTSNFSVTSNLTIETVKKLGNLIAEEVGPNSAEANTLTVIKTPIIGWDSVINPLAASIGNFTETDAELRIRFRNTKFERSSNIMDSLYSALVSLDSVDNVTVYENDSNVYADPETGSPDPGGIPPHSFTVVILGGDSAEIANTIWKNKPMGIASNGNTFVDITDSQGFEQRIYFQRPSPVTVYISMDIQYDEQYPADGASQIRSAIIAYAQENFGVGEDVVYSRLYTPINEIPGHQITNLTIGTSPSPVGTSNIPIAFDEIASFESVNIIINQTEL